MVRLAVLVAVALLFLFTAACSSDPDEPLAPVSDVPTSVPASQPSVTSAATVVSEPTPNDAASLSEIKVPAMDSRRHLERPDEAHEPYNSIPATSGPHFPVWWQEWGVVDEELPDELVIHNMEHGGVIIRYDCPEGCPDLVSQLAEVTFRYQKVILSPYTGLGTRIAVAAWTYLDKFDEFDEDRIVQFIDAHMNSPESPEPLVFP
jgi:hypothetical protein